MTQQLDQNPPRPDHPPWIAQFIDPWTRSKEDERYRSVTCDNENMVAGLTIAAPFILAFAVFQLVSLNFVVAAFSVLAGLGSIVAAQGFPTFLYTSGTPAHRLQPGHLVKAESDEITEITAVFDDHGAGSVYVALANGNAKTYDSGDVALIATPHAVRLLRQVGLDAPPHDFHPIDQHVLDLLHVSWDQAVKSRGRLDRDDLEERLEQIGIDSDTLEAAIRERLLFTERTGLGRRRHTNIHFTDAGFIALQAHLRNEGIEMHPDSAPLEPMPTYVLGDNGTIISGNNDSIITSQIGDQNSADIHVEQNRTDSIRHLADLVLLLKNPPAEFLAVQEDDVLQPLGTALEREIDRDEIDPTRVCRLVGSIKGLVGDVIPSVLGSAAWSAIIKTWV